MITVRSESMKGSKLQMGEGVELVFDANGLCNKVDTQTAILLYSFPGMTVEGLSDEEVKTAIALKNERETQAVADSKTRFSGLSTPESERAMATSGLVEPYTGPTKSRIPADIAAKIKAKEEEVKAKAKAVKPSITVSTPTEPEVRAKALPKPGIQLKKKLKRRK